MYAKFRDKKKLTHGFLSPDKKYFYISDKHGDLFKIETEKINS
jgi:hypothetical protein